MLHVAHLVELVSVARSTHPHRKLPLSELLGFALASGFPLSFAFQQLKTGQEAQEGVFEPCSRSLRPC